jgi:exoribonuclease-2
MAVAPVPGSLVSVWEGGSLALGVVVGEEKRRVRLIVKGGKEIRVAPNRLGWRVEDGGAVPGPTIDERREAGRRVERAEARVAGRAAEIDVDLLWEVVVEGGSEGRIFSTAELAELALESGAGEAMTALVRALRADAMHFARKGEEWVPRTPEQVTELRRERERVAARASETRDLFDRLREVVRGAEFQAGGGEFEARYLAALRQLAIQSEAAPDGVRSMALEALEASGLRYDRPHEGAFRLLRRTGEFDHDDVNLQILRYGLRTDFGTDLLARSEELARDGFDASGREDLTRLEAISIDGPHTREIDDALSVERLSEGGFRLGVHIADPGAFVRPGEPLDEEALARGLTHYHPDQRLTMLPPALAEVAASLLAGQQRPALSFLVDLESTGEVCEWRILRSVVRSAGRLDYPAVDRTVAEGDGPFAELILTLARLAEGRKRVRLGRGAISIEAPEVDFYLGRDGAVHLERIEASSVSRRIVSEAMILAGEIAARQCGEAELPAIYRRQAAPATAVETPADGAADPVTARRLRRSMSRAETGLRPGPHHGLGLEAYVQITSPLRRFQDLATHRQIAAHLAGESLPYDADALQRIAATTEQAEIDARRAERAAEEYWLLRYLERSSGEIVEALVVETEPRPVVQLAETLREQPMPSLAGVEPGQRVDLRVERVNPRAGLLVLRRDQ